MIEIPLTKGYVALIDDEDFELVSKYKWGVSVSAKGRITAEHTFNRGNGKTGHIKMSRLLMGAVDPKIKVDHINRNTLDNTRKNLRLATNGQNLRNTKLYKTNSSGYRGVSKTKGGKWVSSVRLYSLIVHLGTFASAKEAAIARDRAAILVYGEFATLNFSKETLA